MTDHRSPYALPAGNVQIAFSGGRSSALMLHEIIAANGALPEDRVQVLFQNTGREFPQTLDFVAECAQRWGVMVTWLEYQPEKPLFRVVGRQGASENGEPFEALIRRKRYLPNAVSRFCTQEMKIRTAKRYLLTLGWRRWTTATGIRADEPLRLGKTPPKDRWTVWNPLADAGVSRADVAAFWKRQPFDLRLPNVNGSCPLGNCDGCFLKSEANLSALARDFPERHRWWEDMEAKVAGLTTGAGGRWRKDYTRRDLRTLVERHGDWIFDAEGALCQADEGECLG